MLKAARLGRPRQESHAWAGAGKRETTPCALATVAGSGLGGGGNGERWGWKCRQRALGTADLRRPGKAGSMLLRRAPEVRGAEPGGGR